ncbi:MAG: hypothetical protein ACRDRJ_28275 [Streptosporangiaceae bacterium]
MDALNELAQSVNSSSALVFLVAESERTHRACRTIVMAIGNAQGSLHLANATWSRDLWVGLNNELAQKLRELQVAARNELEVGGIDPALILDRKTT